MVAKSKSLTHLNLWLWKMIAMRMSRVFTNFLFHDVINVNVYLDFFLSIIYAERKGSFSRQTSISFP